MSRPYPAFRRLLLRITLAVGLCCALDLAHPMAA